jgi:hypothetical protein
MEFVAAGAAWALNNVSPQRIFAKLGLTSLLASDTAFRNTLSPNLSQDASIILSNEAGFSNATLRWRDWHSPQVGAVVNAFTQSDVQEAVSRLLLPCWTRLDNLDPEL